MMAGAMSFYLHADVRHAGTKEFLIVLSPEEIRLSRLVNSVSRDRLFRSRRLFGDPDANAKCDDTVPILPDDTAPIFHAVPIFQGRKEV